MDEWTDAQMKDDMHSGKLIWAFSSGELKRKMQQLDK